MSKETVRTGQSVTVNYNGFLDDGTIFDSSEADGPFSFTTGTGQVIPGFETAVVGMQVGETKTTKLSVEEAYGERNIEAVIVVERSSFPEDMELEVGMTVQGEGPNGPFPAIVTAVASNGVTIDANHPLAGQALNFEIELLSINEEE